MTKGIDNERLAGAIEALTEQVSVLRESIDEFRSAIRWGIENDKFQSSPEPSDSTDDLVAVVQSTIRDEVAVIQDSLNEFSIDMQWAVRQIRSAAETVKTQLLLFRGDD